MLEQNSRAPAPEKLGQNVSTWAHGGAMAPTENSGDVCEGHTKPLSGCQVIRGKWGVPYRILQLMTFHSADSTLNRAAVGATTAFEAKGFAVD
jgi:hypothetical protein